MTADDAPEAFKAQLRENWRLRRAALALAARLAKEAAKRWDAAVMAEMAAHRRMVEFGAAPDNKEG